LGSWYDLDFSSGPLPFRHVLLFALLGPEGKTQKTTICRKNGPEAFRSNPSKAADFSPECWMHLHTLKTA